eukprot:scaffold4373_cov188-Prasinococcus_capsulatus_cf.AAC.1
MDDPSIHPSIRPSVRPSVRPSIHPSIHPSTKRLVCGAHSTHDVRDRRGADGEPQRAASPDPWGKSV